METTEKKLEEILSSVERIVANREDSNYQGTLDINAPTDISNLLGDLGEIHDQEQMYQLYYKGIQRLLATYLPANEDITKVIRNLSSTILSKHMKDKRGVRGADSRQASVGDYQNLMDVYASWATKNPSNLLGLATELLEKGKEKNIIPEDATLQDFLD